MYYNILNNNSNLKIFNNNKAHALEYNCKKDINNSW